MTDYNWADLVDLEELTGNPVAAHAALQKAAMRAVRAEVSVIVTDRLAQWAREQIQESLEDATTRERQYIEERDKLDVQLEKMRVQLIDRRAERDKLSRGDMSKEALAAYRKEVSRLTDEIQSIEHERGELSGKRHSALHNGIDAGAWVRKLEQSKRELEAVQMPELRMLPLLAEAIGR